MAHVEPEYPYWWHGIYLTKLQPHHQEPKFAHLILSYPEINRKFFEKNMDLSQTLKEVTKDVFLNQDEEIEMIPISEIYFQIIEKLRVKLGMEFSTVKLKEIILKEFELAEMDPERKILLYLLREFMEEKKPQGPDNIWLKCFEPVMVDLVALYKAVMVALDAIIKGEQEPMVIELD